jgi:hypothetical protein
MVGIVEVLRVGRKNFRIVRNTATKGTKRSEERFDGWRSNKENGYHNLDDILHKIHSQRHNAA